jgi:sarcosine oxidase subunit gamma
MSEPRPASLRHDHVRPARTIALSQRPAAAMISLRGNGADPDFVKRASRALDLPLPVTPGSLVAANERSCLWQGPDEWLVIDLEGQAEPLCQRLDRALDGIHCAVTDVSGNRLILRIAGEAAAELLSIGCSLDLDARVFTPGMVAQTLLARANVTLIKFDDGSFDVHVRRSFARYLKAWLVNAATGLC